MGRRIEETYTRIPEGDRASGAILAAVQDSLAVKKTRRFWDRRDPEFSGAVALAIKPMLTVTFEVSRTSPDDPMSFEFGGSSLPNSPYTEKVVKTGGELAAEVFPALAGTLPAADVDRDRRRRRPRRRWFPDVDGAPDAVGGAVLLDDALGGIDAILADLLDKLEMPARRAAYDYLLKRARYRRKLDEEVGGNETGGRAGSGNGSGARR